MDAVALSPGAAVLIAVSGLVIVFMILALLLFMISLVSRVVGGAARPKAAPVPAVPAAPAPSGGSWGGGPLHLIGVDDKTAACIMAIVSAETGIPLSQLVFKKIRAL